MNPLPGRQGLSRIATLSPLSMGLGIFLLALAVRVTVAVLVGLPWQPISSGEPDLIARSIAETGVFGNPYRSFPTGPTSHAAPFYPYFLSLIFRTFGYGFEARCATLAASALMASAQYGLLPLLAARVGLPAWIGGLAGLLGAMIPFRVVTELTSLEAPYGVAGWILVLIFTLTWMRDPTALRSLSCGAAWGCLLLIIPQVTISFAALAAGVLWKRGRQAVLPLFMLFGMVALALLPWTWRNYATFGELFFIRSNLGLELAVSNYPGAKPEFADNCPGLWQNGPEGATCMDRHPFLDANEARRLVEMGEPAYHRSRMREFKEYVAADPAAFIKRSAQRVVLFWFMPSRNQRFKDLFLFPLTALAMFGAWRIARRLPDYGWVLSACLIFYPSAYYFLSLITRYRFPIEWLIWLLGTYGLTTLLPRRWWEFLQIPYPASMGGSWPRMAPLSSPEPPAQAA